MPRADGIHWRTGAAPDGNDGASDSILALLSPDSPTILNEPEARWHWAEIADRRPDAITFWRSSPQTAPAERGYDASLFSADVFINLDDHFSRTQRYPTDVVLLNELNLNYERGDDASDVDPSLWPARYQMLGVFLGRLLDACRQRAADRGWSIRWWFQPWSPGHGEQEWSSYWVPIAKRYDGICLHGYGMPDSVTDQVTWYAQQFLDQPLFLGEWNADTYPGDRIAIEPQIRGRLRRLCELIDRLNATYFIYRWGEAGDPNYDIEEIDARRAVWDGRVAIPDDAWEPPEGMVLSSTSSPDPGPPDPAQPDAEEPVVVNQTPPGLDLSNNNPLNIDFAQVAASGMRFGICKVSQGSGFVDRNFSTYYAGLGNNGMIRGGYHYAKPSQNPGTQGAVNEANFFVDTMLRLVGGALTPGDLAALDLEDPDVAASADLSDWAWAFCSQVTERLSFAPLLYTGFYYAQEHGLANRPELGNLGLWLANYQSTWPVAPAPWSVIAIWQHTDNILVPGCPSPVDGNYFNGPIENLPKYGMPRAVTPGPPGPLDPEYAVGSGLLDLMTARGDRPASGEDFPNDWYSESMGESGAIYRWNKKMGKAYVYPAAAS